MIKKIVQNTKTLHVRPNGRSADYITPNFMYDCAGGCRNSYCYVMRYNYETLYINENIDQILDVLDKHIANLPTKISNQTDSKYWTYDIGCSTDVSLNWKHTNWLKIFNFFKEDPRAKATFATKYVNPKLLNFNPENKIRIRFSLMPARMSEILEPKTSPIIERIKAVNIFIEAGYEVHLNFAPIIAYEGWLTKYTKLFEDLAQYINNQYKPFIKAECIFLTHNDKQHERNIASNRLESEALIWQPNIQENKVSEYVGKAVRYKAGIKSSFIQRWSVLHDRLSLWNKILYILTLPTYQNYEQKHKI